VISSVNSFSQPVLQIEDDYLLCKVRDLLPPGWQMITHSGGGLMIEKNEQVYVLFENRINAPLSTEKKDELEKRIKKNGKKVLPHFEFKCYNRLTDDFLLSAKKQNDSVYTVLNLLPKKYGIEHLRDNFASSKGEMIFKGNTDEENEKIKKFNIEKYNLLDKIVKLPDYNSEKYSLYLDNTIGIEDEFHLVCPSENSTEMYKILEILGNNLSN